MKKMRYATRLLPVWSADINCKARTLGTPRFVWFGYVWISRLRVGDCAYTERGSVASVPDNQTNVRQLWGGGPGILGEGGRTQHSEDRMVHSAHCRVAKANFQGAWWRVLAAETFSGAMRKHHLDMSVSVPLCIQTYVQANISCFARTPASVERVMNILVVWVSFRIRMWNNFE